MKTVYSLVGAVLFGAIVHGQAARPVPPAAPAAKDIILTASSANVKESGTPVKIRIFRWSSDEERTPLVASLTAPPPGAGRAAGGRPGGGGGRGANAGAARGAAAPAAAPPAAAPADAAPDQAQAGDAGAGDPQAGRAARAGGAGGGRGRGGRGGDAAPLTPIQAFTAALQKAPTVGYIWTTDVTGYSIKYAWHTTQPDGTERIVLATDRRLGAYSPAWTLNNPGTPTDYEFTLLELHLDPKGGEGKASLTTKLVADNDTKQLGLENYAAAPTILQNVKRSAN
jgi:hypothetical protein